MEMCKGEDLTRGAYRPARERVGVDGGPLGVGLGAKSAEEDGGLRGFLDDEARLAGGHEEEARNHGGCWSSTPPGVEDAYNRQGVARLGMANVDGHRIDPSFCAGDNRTHPEPPCCLDARPWETDGVMAENGADNAGLGSFEETKSVGCQARTHGRRYGAGSSWEPTPLRRRILRRV